MSRIVRPLILPTLFGVLAACAHTPPAAAPLAPAPASAPAVVPGATPPGDASAAPPARPVSAVDQPPPADWPVEADLPTRHAKFVADASAKYHLVPAEVSAWLQRAEMRQSIVDAMSRPAEGVRTWATYRPIFVTGSRISAGREFLAKHRAALAQAEARTGVPAEVIVAIIGVETSYGGNTGSYKVLDALYTLGFFYPSSGDPAKRPRELQRGAFFRDELAQAMLLAKEEGLDLATMTGSYAGAMGYGQFMPSSYRAYARDGDGDGRRDLFRSLPDVFVSVANYFVAHGWQRDQPVVARAAADPGAAPFAPETLEAKYTPAELAAKGYRPAATPASTLPATLLTFEGVGGTEHWFGYPNFHVITRYNRSPMYAMAVYQLAREIAGKPLPGMP